MQAKWWCIHTVEVPFKGVMCVRVCDSKLHIIHENINSAPSFNCIEDDVCCTHIVCIPYCVLHLKWNVFIAIPLFLSFSCSLSISIYVIQNRTYVHTNTRTLQTRLNKFRIDARVKFTTANPNEKPSIHSSLFFIFSRSFTETLTTLTQWIFT